MWELMSISQIPFNKYKSQLFFFFLHNFLLNAVSILSMLDLVLLSVSLLGSKGIVRSPLGGVARVGLLQHGVDLLQRQTLGLRDQEECVNEAACAQTSPHVKDLGAQVGLVRVHHVGSNDGNDAVPQPVGRSGEGNTSGADLQRVDFTNEHPRARAPGGGEEEDVDADEGDHGGGGGGGAGDGADDGDDELADDHAEGTPDEQGATAEALDGPEGDGGGDDVDDGGDHGDEEGVLDGAEVLEEGGAEVEDKVDTGPLLHHLPFEKVSMSFSRILAG